MKKLFAVILSLVLIISVFSGCTKTDYTFSNSSTDTDDSSYVKAVSFNCAAPWGNVLKGTGSSARVKRFAGYMSAVHPDIIGTQEMNSKWMDAISEVMNSYDSYGVKRGGDDSEKKSEMNSIFWLKDKYECLKKIPFGFPKPLTKKADMTVQAVTGYAHMQFSKTEAQAKQFSFSTLISTMHQTRQEHSGLRLFWIKLMISFLPQTQLLTG